MARNNNGGHQTTNETDADRVAATERELEALVEKVRAEAAEAQQTGLTRPEAAAASTMSVIKHLEAIAEQATLKQCQVVQGLISEARELEEMMMADLARVKGHLRLLLINGERAAIQAQSIRETMNEMRSQQAAIIEAKTI